MADQNVGRDARTLSKHLDQLMRFIAKTRLVSVPVNVFRPLDVHCLFFPLPFDLTQSMAAIPRRTSPFRRRILADGPCTKPLTTPSQGKPRYRGTGGDLCTVERVKIRT